MKKSNIGTIAGKEFYRFFHDKGLLFSLIFPAILLYFIYAFAIPGFSAQSKDSQKSATLYIVNVPNELQSQFGALGCTLVRGTDAEDRKSVV